MGKILGLLDALVDRASAGMWKILSIETQDW